MRVWVRIVGGVMAVGIAANLAVVLASNGRNQREMEMQRAREEGELRAILEAEDGGSRRMEIAVEWQKLDGEGKVLESGLVVRQYRPTHSGGEMPVQAGTTERFTMEGNQVQVEGVVMSFDGTFGREGRLTTLFRGKRLPLFRRVAQERQEGGPSGNVLDLLTKWECPKGEWLGDGPTEAQRRAWAEAWDRMPEMVEKGELAAGQGVVVKRVGPVNQVVERGKKYEVWLTVDGISMEEKAGR